MSYRPFAISLKPGTSLANLTGTWRTARPVYLDRLPPCNNACPAGENIQGWLFHAESGDYEQAWRVCYHPCESACNRGQLDALVGINSVECFLGDEAIKRGWKFTDPTIKSGRNVKPKCFIGREGRLCQINNRMLGVHIVDTISWQC
jgi:hypothetical protein